MLKGDGLELNGDWNVLMGDWRELREHLMALKGNGKMIKNCREA